MAERARIGGYDPDYFEGGAAELAALVPEDYLLIGTGSCVYQLQLERAPIHAYRDFSDLYVGGDLAAERVIADARAYGRVAFYLSTDVEVRLLEQFLASGESRLVASGNIGGVPVYCYACD